MAFDPPYAQETYRLTLETVDGDGRGMGGIYVEMDLDDPFCDLWKMVDLLRLRLSLMQASDV